MKDIEKEFLPYGTTYMNQEDITISEIGQSQDKHCMILLMKYLKSSNSQKQRVE